MAGAFGPIAAKLADAADTIVSELNAAQGPSMDVGGYFRPDAARVSAAMRPSATLNGIIDSI